MSLNEIDRQQLINYRLLQAQETIDDVELLITNQRWRASVNRIYYGMFYSLLALGLKYEYETSKHAQLIGWFNKNFIAEQKLDIKYGKIINKAFNRRTKGDYDSFVDFDEETVLEMYEELKDFTSTLKQFLNS